MRMTNKRLTVILLSLALAMLIGLLPGMSLTAWADDTTGEQLTAETTNLTNGTYYLSDNVALNSEMQITSGNVIINLNGYTLSLKSDADAWQSVIYVNGGNLTINGNGGKISGGTGGHNQRGGGFHIDAGSVTVNEVDITGNKGSWGGGVFINSGTGSFTMNNSYIQGNTSINDGNGWNDAGGVYLDGGTFTINGGSITNNYVTGGKKNGVVIATSAVFNISGDVIIYDNKDGESQENLFADSLFSGDAGLNIIGPLGQNAKIGITSKWHQVFTNSSDTTYNDPTKFVSDNSDYRVGRNIDGKLMLARYNEIIYSATGYSGVYNGSEHGIEVIASDPDTAIIHYGTSADNCNLVVSPVYKDVTETTVYYEITAPVGADNINYETVKGSVTVKIDKADNPLTYAETQTVEKTFSSVAQSETLKEAADGEGDISYTIESQKSGEDSVGYFTLDGTTLNIAASTPAGTYVVVITASAAGNDNYNSETKYSVVTVTITEKEEPEPEPMETYTVKVTDDGNGTAKADPDKGAKGTEVTLTATPNEGYQFKEWQVVSGGVTLADNTAADTSFFMGDENVEIKANFEALVKQTVQVDNVKQNGSRGVPSEIKDLEVTLNITITGDDGETATTVEPLKLTVKGGAISVTGTGKFDKSIDLAPGKQTVTVTVSPKAIYGRDKIDSVDGPVEGPVKWKYELSAKGEINEVNGKMIIRIYLIWDDGSRPEELKVYALPEDEIGAYELREDGTKEYLLFHTYDICMQWLGSDELCRGYERCFHKESPFVNPFVKP